MDPLRTGVIGLGKMGLHHVRCVGEADGLELAGAADVDATKAGRLAPGVPFSTEAGDLLDRCDAVVLAVPTDRHEQLGLRILEAGCHLLIEKPLASTTAACRKLEEAAGRAGLVLGVGHVERMNGAYRGVSGRIENPRFVEGHRLAGFDLRGTEVDVVLDLMIHDLDLVLDIFGSEPDRVDAVGVSVLSDRIDIANARLDFPGGGLANLTASRVSREPVRKLRVFQEETYLSLNLRTQEAEVFARNPGAPPAGFSRETMKAPEGYNPLVRELQEFAAAVRGEASLMTGAREGTGAVALAERVVKSIEQRQEKWSPARLAGDAPCVDAPS